MPFTLAAYYATLQANGLTQLNALGDQSLNVINNQFQITPSYSKLAAGYVCSANAIEGELVSPSLRKYANYYIAPCDAAANPSANPPFEYMGFYNPLKITTGDLLQMLVDNANNSQVTKGLVWLCNDPVQPVRGEIFPVYCTSTTTLTAGAWTLGTLTPQTTLEEGIYAIVGMHVHFNGAVAARLVFPGSMNAMRPGVIAASTAAAPMPLCFRHGRLGDWGHFEASVFPQMEFLGTAATTSEKIHLDLIKLSIGAQAGPPGYQGTTPTQSLGVSPAPVPLH